jgi:hypothetical protein
MVLLGAIALLAGTTGLLFAFTGVEARATIPFDFYIENQLLPAGEYVFNMGRAGYATSSAVTVRSKEGVVILMVSTLTDVNEDHSNAYLKFNRYGNKHFLSSVAIRSYKANLVATNLEKEMRAQLKREPTAFAMLLK